MPGPSVPVPPASRRLLETIFIFFLVLLLARLPHPASEIGIPVNAGQLATAVYCYQLLLLIEVVALSFYTSVYFLYIFSPLINLYKVSEYGIS